MSNSGEAMSDLICFSHLRWHFVWQRPQHLLSRASQDRRVWFVEEPQTAEGEPRLEIVPVNPQLSVVTPQLPLRLDEAAQRLALQGLMESWWRTRAFDMPLTWYYTPMAWAFSSTLPAGVVVYDCMDELSLFQGAPPALRALEQQLLARADLVFTGGRSLYEAKKHQHKSVHAFPSSVDVGHFAAARHWRGARPLDQDGVPRPRIGFFGVIDERLDIGLLRGLAAVRPDYHFVMLGPTAKVDPASLPSAPNVHYLGMKGYDELPAYLAGWDVAMLPFARNDATRFISPTKTPEYLAAGRPVVSTSIADVVEPYGERGFVRIADDPWTFARAIDNALADGPERLQRVDTFLSTMSWDRTWQGMQALIEMASRPVAPTGRPGSTHAGPTDPVFAGPAA
ncbi:Putative teichuronic acid biosynthesis glycosyltransferase TuaH [Luteitalea pratensis]|uniref:Teichuronic acid biosynthesis glycosyltransferase TuaH n=1 Tax=Luteitalea pratensis TaxID=1855912 RepID=A0A143PSV2_LUTPR|nr:glycosyltransferase family 1 protein [Luteitalea pratensis]AMY11807.1 Putative teichuronic acid biosynthesis glycosyltransferase TuaH [Luteitalea pratensis]